VGEVGGTALLVYKINIRGGGWGYLSPSLQISIRGGGGLGYCSPGIQISIRGRGGWGTALLVYKKALGVEEDGIPLSWFTHKY
jgi:hypothetical protein